MLIIVYLSIALGATLLGAITGIGGGVLMKPVMDLLGDYDAATIGVLSAGTLFTMSAVSCVRQLPQQKGISIARLLLLGAGSVAGGLAGQFLFEAVRSSAANDSLVKIVQNGTQAAILAVIFVYMLCKDRVGSLHLRNFVFYPLAGCALGVVSAFLGVGGGPINVAALSLLFGMDVKKAGFCSIAVILFAQASKLVTVAVQTGYAAFDLSVLPYMCIGAVVGALTGSWIKKKIREQTVVWLFNGAQLLIIGICIFNIIRLAV